MKELLKAAGVLIGVWLLSSAIMIALSISVVVIILVVGSIL